MVMVIAFLGIVFDAAKDDQYDAGTYSRKGNLQMDWR